MMAESVQHQHLWANRLQTALLVLFLIGIGGLSGGLRQSPGRVGAEWLRASGSPRAPLVYRWFMALIANYATVERSRR